MAISTNSHNNIDFTILAKLQQLMQVITDIHSNQFYLYQFAVETD